ncbi:HesB/YadR/YfhF family protein [Neobacillus vireti]|uniref:HesB/YadR/YfhF family protein n=1 Tax=Neobacillus vireti TaxID=220686 RepID=UPI002FFE74C9
MIISIDEKAAKWLTNEFQNNSVRMYPQYDGFGVKNKGFSLAFSAEAPSNIGFTKEIKGVRLYVEGNDVWFFEDTETCLSYNEDVKEIQISFKETIAIN